MAGSTGLGVSIFLNSGSVGAMKLCRARPVVGQNSTRRPLVPPKLPGSSSIPSRRRNCVANSAFWLPMSASPFIVLPPPKSFACSRPLSAPSLSSPLIRSSIKWTPRGLSFWQLRLLLSPGSKKWFIPPTLAVGSNKHAATHDPRIVEIMRSGFFETKYSPWKIVFFFVAADATLMTVCRPRPRCRSSKNWRRTASADNCSGRTFCLRE